MDKIIHSIELHSDNLDDIIEFKAIKDSAGFISVYAETDLINEWVCDFRRLSYKRFVEICTEFAETFERE